MEQLMANEFQLDGGILGELEEESEEEEEEMRIVEHFEDILKREEFKNASQYYSKGPGWKTDRRWHSVESGEGILEFLFDEQLNSVNNVLKKKSIFGLNDFVVKPVEIYENSFKMGFIKDKKKIVNLKCKNIEILIN